jgi:hypothetical protein
VATLSSGVIDQDHGEGTIMDQRAIFSGGDRHIPPWAEMAEPWVPGLICTAQGEPIRVGYGQWA